MKRRSLLKGTAAATVAAVTGSTAALGAGSSRLSGDNLFEYVVCVDTFWTDLPFLDRLVKVAEAGFKRFEFWRFKDKDVDAVGRVCREHDLTPQQFVAGWSMNSPDRRAQFISDLKEAVVVADKLGVRLMTAIAGFNIEGVSREQQIEEVVMTLREAEGIARKADVTLMIEGVNVRVDHPGQIVVTAQDAADVVNAVGSPNVRLLFDVYHQQISGGDLSGNIEAFKDLIVYYQIADHPGRHEPGTGEINFTYVLRAIHDSGYTGPIGLEFKPSASPEAALQAVREVDQKAAHSSV